MVYAVGQRWVSSSEPNLGLGIIIFVDERVVEMAFLAHELVRSYARRNAPLIRVIYEINDEIIHKSGQKYLVDSVEELDQLVYYNVHPLPEASQDSEPSGSVHLSCIPEAELASDLQFVSPKNRLFYGQIDKKRWFDQRYKTLTLQRDISRSGCSGYLGPRVSLIPHQFHIAKEVSSRYHPRVLLADEVGLGKTIEAGLILHQQLISGVVKRAIVIVPENLLHQWLVEMARRFNLTFSLFDEERCNSYEDENPFETEQLILCSQDFLEAHRQRQSQLLDAEWDMLIVDEAHHLQWAPDCVSEAYTLVEKLAQHTPSVLLLTATPEQLGPKGHFARLRLLDPHRFHDLESFLLEEDSYIPVAQTARKISQLQLLENNDKKLILQFLDVGVVETYQQAVQSQSESLNKLSKEMISKLIDQHGTGRVLFRNTRKNIQGFPRRILNPLPCHAPGEQLTKDADLGKMIAPSVSPEDDLRFAQVVNLLKQSRLEKFVLICASPETVLELDTALRVKYGIHSAIFHEGLSIIERDRAAAFFADPEENCPILICSEIGSEGRNFQFAHHLILFDLPLNPDLLEQRIGRLDRIGQKHDIRIHVPYFENHPQNILFDWYHKGLNAFQKSSSTGSALYALFGEALQTYLFQQANDEINHELLAEFINQVSTQRTKLEKKLEEGRDPLLELNSSAPANFGLLEQLTQTENDSTLMSWLTSTFDLYGVDYEDGPHDTLVAHPTNHMRVPHFPELPDEGLSLCFDRETALAREDVQFMSYDHPMVRGVNELILNHEKGNSSFTTIKLPNVKPGAFLLEAVYTVEIMAPRIYQAQRFLPLTPIRILMDEQGKDLSAKVTFQQLATKLEDVKKDTARAIVKSEATRINKLIAASQSVAEAEAEKIRTGAMKDADESLRAECDRLLFLKGKNPSIRQSEVDFAIEKKNAVLQHVQNAPLHLNALRIIVTI